MFYCDCQKFNLTPVAFLFFDSWWQAEEYLPAALNQEYGKLQKRILSQVYFRDFVHRYWRAFKNEAPKFSKIYHTLAITIYHYCNLDLVVTIVKIIQNIFENAKNKIFFEKLGTCEEGGAHFRISFWHLLMNLKNK